MEKGSKLSAHAAVLGANVIFGINFSVVKLITPSVFAPLGLNVVRIVVSTALFWLLFLIGGKGKSAGIQRKDWKRFFWCAVTGVAINQILFIKGLALTSSVHASLLILCTPILITFIAAWLLNDRLHIWKILGLIIGISGAGLLVVLKDSTGQSNWWGDVLVMINAMSYAFYLVWVRPLMQRYDPIHIIRWVFTIGMCIIVPLGWQDYQETNWDALNYTTLMAIIFVVIGATFLAYLFNIYGVKNLGSAITGTYIYTQPLFAAVVASLFLNEAWTWHKLLSAALIATGVYLVGRKTPFS